MGIDNFMQISSLQLSLSVVFCTSIQLSGELILLKRAMASNESLLQMLGIYKLSIKGIFIQLKV